MDEREKQMIQKAVGAVNPGGKTFGTKDSLRDQFAGIALQSIIMEPVPQGSMTLVEGALRDAFPDAVERAQIPTVDAMACTAYLLADAMLRARARKLP